MQSSLRRLLCLHFAKALQLMQDLHLLHQFFLFLESLEQLQCLTILFRNLFLLPTLPIVSDAFQYPILQASISLHTNLQTLAYFPHQWTQQRLCHVLQMEHPRHFGMLNEHVNNRCKRWEIAYKGNCVGYVVLL